MDDSGVFEQLQADLERYTGAKQWRKVVETIEKFVALESQPARRGGYYLTAAIICRDELCVVDEALDHFESSLDNFFADLDQLPESRLPYAMKGFAAIERLLSAREEWSRLDRAYRKMIRRASGTGALAFLTRLQAGLFDRLGEVYRLRLGNLDAAAMAFETARKLDPDGQVRTEGIDRAALLAELQQR